MKNVLRQLIALSGPLALAQESTALGSILGSLILMALTMAAFAVLLHSGKGLFFGWFLSPADKANFLRLMQTTERLLPALWINLVVEAVAMVLTGVFRGLGRTSRLLNCQFLASVVVWLPLVFLVHALRPSVLGFWLTMSVCSAVLSLLLLLPNAMPLKTRPRATGSPSRN